MLDLAMTSTVIDESALVVGYTCPCGCTPAVTYRRHEAVATEGCCCGNELAVGPDAASAISVAHGFEVRTASVDAPWHERVPVMWAIGPSTHPEADDHHDLAEGRVVEPGTAIDPVCGMTVDIAAAVAKDLHATHLAGDYYFCGKGCKLDFLEDPARYLDPSYVPSM